MNANEKCRMNHAADEVDARLTVLRDEMWSAVFAAIEGDRRAGDRLELALAHAQAVLDKIALMRQVTGPSDGCRK